MMRFIPLIEKYPDIGQIILIKLKPSNLYDVNYYVVYYYKKKNGESCFEEADGECYRSWSPNEIIGWMPLEELDNVPFARREG